jgi:Pectate lyase superfamily protein
MSNGSTSTYAGFCRKDIPYPSVSNESVPSLIDNLVTALYGEITKTVVNRRVQWYIPCDPNNTAIVSPSFPRLEGEGLLCYIIRVFQSFISGGSDVFSPFLNWSYTGNGSTTTYNLTDATALLPAAYLVYIDGVVQAPSNYTIASGNPLTIVFSTAIPNGSNVVIVCMGTASTGEVSTANVVATGSTTPRTLANRFSDVVNILDYGADPTGVNDSYYAIVAAVNSIPSSNFSGGGVIFYPAGTYKTSASLPDVANVTHIGSGINSTIVKATGNFPVYSRSGSQSVTINGGGIQNMTIQGYWNPATPSSNTNSHGISVIGSNGAIYRNIWFFNCFYGMYLAFNYESRMEDISVLGQYNLQNYIGYFFDSTNNANVNNAIYVNNCGSSFTADCGWKINNANGSTFTDCAAENCGTWGFIIGSGSSLTIPCQFQNFVNCVGDTNPSGNYLIQASSLGGVQDLQFSNCWSGYTTNGSGWDFVNAQNITMESCVSYSDARNGTNLNNSPIVINGYLARQYNTSNGGYAGINIYNTNGVIINGSNISTTYTSVGGRSVDENGTSNYNLVQSNILTNGGQILGANSMFRNNQGLVTENTGSVTISAGATTAIVTHGLAVTPTIGEITLTTQGNFYASVTSINSTTFTITIPSLGSSATIGWGASIIRK